MQSPVRVACVVSTVGRPVHLDRLLRSLAEQTVRPVQVIVVDQSRTAGTAGVVGEWSDRLPLRRITSGRGASLGRNAGLAVLGTDVDVVTFPDDDVRLAADALALAAQAFTAADPTTGVIVGVKASGSHPSQSAEPMLLDDRTVWSHAIEWTCFFRASFLGAVGGFDESLGVGGPTPWQSGEGTDLLLRGLHAGWTIRFEPAIALYETGDPETPAERAYQAKARHYARGTGRVFRRHHRPGRQAFTVLRPLAGVALTVLKGRPREIAWHWQRAIGRAEGLAGRVLPFAPGLPSLEARGFRDEADVPARVAHKAT